MKLKKITLDFPAPLTQIIHYQGQDVTQEDILFTDLEGIRDKVRKELNKILKGIDVVRKFGLDFFQVVTCRVEGIQVQMDCMMAWRRDDTNPCIYYIYYPMDAEALLTIKDIGARVPIFGRLLGNKNLDVARILQEKRIIEALRKFSFVEMKLNPEFVIIETTEVDGVEDKLPVCQECGKPVVKEELFPDEDGRPWHKACFKQTVGEAQDVKNQTEVPTSPPNQDKKD